MLLTGKERHSNLTFPGYLDDKPRLGGRCQGSSTAKRRAKRGLDSGRASATLLLSGECHLGSGLHAHTKSLTDLVRLGGLLLDSL